MTGIESVAIALLPLGKTAHAMELAQRIKALFSACQDLVGIGLVAYVPHNLILWQIEGQIQPDGQFHHPEIRGEVASVLGGFLYDKLSDFGREFSELMIIQFLQILRSMYIIQSHTFHLSRCTFHRCLCSTFRYSVTSIRLQRPAATSACERILLFTFSDESALR